VLVVLIVLAFSLLFGSSAPNATASALPPTQPGLGRDEGAFLVTAADDGSRAVYFIAGNARHSVLSTDLQLEVQRNPLWPVRTVSRDDVLAFAEGAPVGAARSGLISTPVVTDEQAVEEVQADAPESVSTPTQPTTYVLKPGDNLTRVSAQYGTSIEAILAANNLTNANRIYVGQTLVIPSGEVTPPAPAVVEAPNQQAPIAEEPDEATVAATTTYTVKPGDSAIGIARQFGVSVEELLAANGVTNRNRVYVGQSLTIPG
jgi:LysM repeat protein